MAETETKKPLGQVWAEKLATALAIEKAWRKDGQQYVEMYECGKAADAHPYKTLS